MKKKFKVTNKNIRLRFHYEHAKDETMGMKQCADLFNVDKMVFWRWASLNKRYANLPSKYKCPSCGESQWDRIANWVNDGSLDHLLKKS